MKDTQPFVHFTASLFLVVLSIAVVWQMLGPSWFRNIKAEVTNQPYARTVTVDGEGKITATPDMAVVDFSVVTPAKTVKEVTKLGNEQMTAVRDALKKMGLEDKDLATVQYDLIPQYPISQPNIYLSTPEATDSKVIAPTVALPSIEDKVQEIIGYNLTQTLQVKIHKLDTVEDVVDTAVKAGANQIGQLYFDIEDASQVKKQAREKAFTAAREKAQDMAEAAGVKLGRVITFSEGYSYMPYANFKMEMTRSMDSGMASNTPAPAIEPGSKEIQITVSVTYQIE